MGAEEIRNDFHKGKENLFKREKGLTGTMDETLVEKDTEERWLWHHCVRRDLWGIKKRICQEWISFTYSGLRFEWIGGGGRSGGTFRYSLLKHLKETGRAVFPGGIS